MIFVLVSACVQSLLHQLGYYGGFTSTGVSDKGMRAGPISLLCQRLAQETLHLFNESGRTGSRMLFGQLINRCDGQLSFVQWSFSSSLFSSCARSRAKSS